MAPRNSRIRKEIQRRKASYTRSREQRQSGSRIQSSDVTNATQATRGLTFDDNNRKSQSARNFPQRQAERGIYTSQGDRNAYATLARVYNQNQRTNNYDYTQPSNYSHDSRYRDIRRAFGMSAG